LTTAGGMKIFGKGPELAAANDIHQLKMALENFKNKFGDYPPSRILLSNNVNDYANDPQSLAILMQLWPRLDWTGQSGPIDWLGNDHTNQNRNRLANTIPRPGVYLEGDQCLVFFLGGIQVKEPTQGTFASIGFATNPKNPTLILVPGSPTAKV